MPLLGHVSMDYAVGEELVEYRCSRCGHSGTAWVEAGGTGLMWIGVSLSKGPLDARVDATQAAQLAPCPRCGARSRAELAKVVLLGVTIGAVAAMATGFMAAEWLLASGSSEVGAVGVAATTIAVAVAITIAIRLRSARRRVEFTRPGYSARQAARHAAFLRRLR